MTYIITTTTTTTIIIIITIIIGRQASLGTGCCALP